MPTYDYRCDACEHEFEEWQSFAAEKLTKCPACKKNKLVRLFGSGAAIVFKGSGFYDTDYRQADEKAKSDRKAAKDAPADAKADPAGDTKAEPKADAKGETKAEPKADAPKADAPKAEAAPAVKESPKEPSGAGGKAKGKRGA